MWPVVAGPIRIIPRNLLTEFLGASNLRRSQVAPSPQLQSERGKYNKRISTDHPFQLFIPQVKGAAPLSRLQAQANKQRQHCSGKIQGPGCSRKRLSCKPEIPPISSDSHPSKH